MMKERRKEGRKVRRAYWVVPLLIFIVGVFSSAGCSGNSNPTAPDSSNPGNPGGTDLGIFRSLRWDLLGDEVVRDSELIDEKNSDITNIVYGNCFGGGMMGHIVRAFPIPVPPFNHSGTVAAWCETDGPEDTDIYFKVLYREGAGPENDDQGIPIPADVDEYQSIWPAVTAHMTLLDDDWLIVVDIVYMKTTDLGNLPWEIMHVRFRQVTPADYDNFTCIQGPSVISFTSGIEGDPCIRPDVVFDAGAGPFLMRNQVHVVWEVCEEYDIRHIWYLRGGEEENGTVDWDLHNGSVSDAHPGLNARPRIDAGFDSYYYGQMVQDPVFDYYVGIVWEHKRFFENDPGNPNDDTWPSGIIFCLIDNWGIIPPSMRTEWIVNPFEPEPRPNDYNVFPYIEIEPIENYWETVATTFITWTFTQDDGSNTYPRAHIDCTNTLRLAFYPDDYVVDLFIPDGPNGRNGLATFAALADNSHRGHLTWLNDTGNNTPVEVYAGDVTWELFPNFFIDDGNWYNISLGVSGINAPDLTLGPEVAVFIDNNDDPHQTNQAKCVWTDRVLISPDPPLYDLGIYADTSDA